MGKKGAVTVALVGVALGCALRWGAVDSAVEWALRPALPAGYNWALQGNFAPVHTQVFAAGEVVEGELPAAL